VSLCYATILPGAGSGDTLLIETGGVEMEMEMPTGLSEGDAFTVVLVDGGSESEDSSTSQRWSEPQVESSLQIEPGQEHEVGLVPGACTAVWGLNAILKQAKRYAEQQRHMQEQLATAFPQAAATPTDALLAWLRTFPSVVISWCASLRPARQMAACCSFEQS
jgi:hypothetical protein